MALSLYPHESCELDFRQKVHLIRDGSLPEMNEVRPQRGIYVSSFTGNLTQCRINEVIRMAQEEQETSDQFMRAIQQRTKYQLWELLGMESDRYNGRLLSWSEIKSCFFDKLNIDPDAVSRICIISFGIEKVDEE